QERRRKYYWSNFGAQMPWAPMVEYAHRRHQVERFHEEAKGLLGWDQYQGRLWPGFQRHAVTVMLAYSYLGLREGAAAAAAGARGGLGGVVTPSRGARPRAPTRSPAPGGRLAPTRGAA